MAEFRADEMRELAAEAEALERAADELERSTAEMGAEAIPDLCAIYRGTLRPPLALVRGVVCRPFAKVFIGGGPCRILDTVINTLDGICPG